MENYHLEKQFIFRLEKTQHLFGHISLEAIINSHLKHHRNNNIMTLKKVYQKHDNIKASDNRTIYIYATTAKIKRSEYE